MCRWRDSVLDFSIASTSASAQVRTVVRYLGPNLEFEKLLTPYLQVVGLHNALVDFCNQEFFRRTSLRSGD
jgi:hypothetical protein